MIELFGTQMAVVEFSLRQGVKIKYHNMNIRMIMRQMRSINSLGKCYIFDIVSYTKIGSEYDQEILQSKTADKPMVPRGRAT